MLNPAPITDAIVAALRSIGALVTAMAGDQARILAHHYRFGEENRLEKVLYALQTPSILVAWEGTQGGNFNGAIVWKHRFNLYIRAQSVAFPNASQLSYEDLWTLIVNGGPVAGYDGQLGKNIRRVELLAGLEIMDTPSINPRVDAEQMDFFVGTFVIAENKAEDE